MKVSYNSNTFVYCLIAMLLALCYHFDLKVYFWFGSIIFGIRLLWVLLFSSFRNLTQLYVDYCNGAGRLKGYRNESLDNCKEKAAMTIFIIIMIAMAFGFISCLQFCILASGWFAGVCFGLCVCCVLVIAVCFGNQGDVVFIFNAIQHKFNKGEKNE